MKELNQGDERETDRPHQGSKTENVDRNDKNLSERISD